MSTTRRTLPAAFAALALGVGVLTGCASSSPADNSAAACDALETYTAAVESLKSLDADSSLDDIAAARDDLRDARAELQTAADAVAADRADAVREAGEALEEALGDLEGESTVPEALDEVSGELSDLADAQAELEEGLTCA